MQVSGQLHAPAPLPEAKWIPAPIRQEAEWSSELVSMLLKRKKSLTHAGGFVARYYTD
jgi:hypothetical protein